MTKVLLSCDSLLPVSKYSIPTLYVKWGLVEWVRVTHQENKTYYGVKYSLYILISELMNV